MGHVAEQQPHSEPAPEEQPGESYSPGSDLQPRETGPPSGQDIDPEQLRQFQEFQQFQRFQELQRSQGLEGVEGPQGQTGAAPVPAQPAQPAQPPQPPIPTEGRRPPRPRAPRWLQWLGKKLLAWLIFMLLTALALSWAYNHFFGDEDTDRPAAETGGGTYHQNKILTDKPYNAVRQVYGNIAMEDAQLLFVCGRFDQQARQTFASNLGYATCQDAVRGLRDQIKHENDYAESIPSSPPHRVRGDRVTVNSCDFDIKGGPALGTFIVTKAPKGQWLITGHEPGPRQCPTTESSTGPTG